MKRQHAGWHAARRVLFAIGVVLAALVTMTPLPVRAQAAGRLIDLTLERMVRLGLEDSYRVRQLLLDIERTRSLLRAEQAGLKSRVDLQVTAPEFESISEYKWNSDLRVNELVHENTRRWELGLSIRQPVILFGFPTNGTLSLNNRVYRYTQLGEERDQRYYNRYFVGYEQPLFQPNRMKNDLEQAKLELVRSELEFQGDVLEVVNDLADDYFELFETAYQRVIANATVNNLEQAMTAARERIAPEVTRAIELDQLQVELANAREDGQQAASSFRLQVAVIKQRLRLAAQDSITLEPELRVTPVNVEVDRAIELAKTLAPRLRGLDLDRRENEIDLAETRGRDGFRMNVEMTYGRETQDPHFENLWTRPRNSYTINVNAFVPIWDWGERRHRIRAELYSLERTDLAIEQARSEIETNVSNEVRNLSEYQQRALSMQQNLELARQNTGATLARYRAGEVALVDVLQTINRQANTAENFVDSYMGYRRALLRLQEMTYYDFESNQPVLERYSIGTGGN
jgi:outer membrane protein TolC